MGLINTMLKSLNDLLDLTEEGILITDLAGGILFANGRALKLFGQSETNLGNLVLDDLLGSPGRSAIEEISEAVTWQDLYKDELTGKDGEGGKGFPVCVRARKSQWEAQACLLVSVRDRRPRRDLRQSLNQAEDKTKQLIYKTDMYQMATGVLHNVGNALNSINIATQNICNLAKDSKVPQLLKASRILEKHQGDITHFLSQDPTGVLLPEYLQSVGKFLVDDLARLREEVEELQRHCNLIRQLINTQQFYAKIEPTPSVLNLSTLINDALQFEKVSLERHKIQVTVDVSATGFISGNQSKVLHVFLNLIKNAKESLLCAEQKQRKLKITTRRDRDQLLVFISDDGLGLSKSQLNRMFNYGFTTKQEGHGFGLYTCDQTMKELGGTISVTSEGLGKGATFKLVFPNTCVTFGSKGKDNAASSLTRIS